MAKAIMRFPSFQVSNSILQEVMYLKVLNRKFHALSSGHTFAILTLRGKKGEEVNIAEEGVSGEAIFFHEAPKTDYDCAYCKEENTITLGGAEMETERTLFLIIDPNGT